MAVRISDLPLSTSISGEDLLMIVDSPLSGGVTKRISFNDMIKEVNTPVLFSSNVTISGDMSVSTNTSFGNLHITVSATEPTPASSFHPAEKGRIWYDSDYIYVAIDDNTVKRAALSSF